MSETGSSDALFAVGGDVYGWSDVVALAERRGDWRQLAADVRAGLAALRELEARDQPLADEETEESGRQFRYERNLLAADELAAWLDRHRLTMADWHAYLARTLARDRLPAADVSVSVSEDEVAAAVWAEGVCSGRLEQLAAELARLAAVAPGAPPDERDAAFEQFCADAVDEAAELRELEASGLEWMRFTYDVVFADDEGAAHELVLCVRTDGDSLAAAAERAGLDVLGGDCWLDEVDSGFATRLLAAAPGDLAGPVAVEGGFVVAHVISKTAPTLDDEAVRARARDAAVTRAVTRVVADRVAWL